MKKLTTLIALLFAFNLFAQTVGPLEIQADSLIQFECVIPDHGGGCTTQKATLIVHEDLQDFFTVKVSNASYVNNNGFSLKGLKKDNQININLSVDGSEQLQNMLILTEGKNILLLQIFGLQGHVLYEKVVELNAHVKWEY